jgi:AraC family transcriptional activator of tynA and feaB
MNTQLVRLEVSDVWARAGVVSQHPRPHAGESAWNVDRDAHGRIEIFDVGSVRLARIRANPLCVEQTSTLASADELDRYRVLVQVAGRSVLAQAGREIPVSAGDCVLYRGALPFSLRNLERCEQRVVIVPRAQLWGRSREIEALTVRRFGEQSASSRHLAHMLDHAFDTVAQFGEEAAIELAGAAVHLSRLILIESGAGRVRRARADIVRDRVRAYVDQNLRDPDLSVEGIAAALNCSTRYLHKVFAEEDQTVGEYILRLRLERCHGELSRTHARCGPIADIAYSWGFRSLSHFGRAFRQRYGLTPGEQRAGKGRDRE